MDKNINQIAAFLAEQDNPKQIIRFFEELFTPAEIRDIASRWQIVKLLDEGVPQRKIASELHVSLCKITRGSKELKKKSSLLGQAIKSLNQ